MRIENLNDTLAFFPDIDGFWQCQTYSDAEAKIFTQLPQNWETQPNPKAVELHTQLARAQGLQGHLQKAEATINQTRQMISQLGQDLDSKIEVRWLLEQGRLLCLKMNLIKAHQFFVQAWTQANERGLVFHAVDAALMLSAIRPHRQQNEWLQKALVLADSSTDPQVRLWLSHLLFLEGWHEFDFHRFDQALQCFEAALAQENVSQEPRKAMRIQWSRARSLRALGQVEASLLSQQDLLIQMQSEGNINGHVYLEIAECQQLLKKSSLAKSNFELAYKELSTNEWYANNKSDELKRMKYFFEKRF